MVSRNQFFLVLILITVILGIALYTFPMHHTDALPIFPAIVYRDCAPWDGAAFTISVQYDSVATIMISIWQSPNFKSQVMFEFPDESGQVGNTYILPELGPYTILHGEVALERVEQGMPLEGRFSLMDERGAQFEGRFVAEWNNQVVMCG